MKKVLGFVAILIFGWVSSGVCDTIIRLTPPVTHTQLNGTFTINVVGEKRESGATFENRI